MLKMSSSVGSYHSPQKSMARSPIFRDSSMGSVLVFISRLLLQTCDGVRAARRGGAVGPDNDHLEAYGRLLQTGNEGTGNLCRFIGAVLLCRLGPILVRVTLFGLRVRPGEFNNVWIL